MSERNRELLLKAAQRIEQIPESYNQGGWGAKSDRSPCGTVACLAGEIIICSEPTVEQGIKKLFKSMNARYVRSIHDPSDLYVDDLAGELAGFSDTEIMGLFYDTDTWPARFSRQYDRAKTQRGRANAAAALLRYLADGGEV